MLLYKKGDNTGDIIEDIFITNQGNQYTSLPTVSVTSSTGSSATVRAYGDEIGKIVKLKTVELGKGYETFYTTCFRIF